MKRILLLAIGLIGITTFGQNKSKVKGVSEEITVEELKEHIEFLTADTLQGRYPGAPTNYLITDYISTKLRDNRISAFDQKFMVKLKSNGEEVETANIIGLLAGNDPELKQEVIIIGAHYDHLGTKGDEIYKGADDNASGIAALIEIAERVAANKIQLKRSVIFVAFGAEEQGLKGSEYYTKNPLFPLNPNTKLMINIDMLGSLNKKSQLFMGGAGTFPGGEDLMKELGNDSDLKLVVHAGSVGGSDHVSFYEKGVSVIGFHTGGNDHYHKTSDTIEHLNLEGEVEAANFIYEVIMAVVASDREMKFIKQD